MMRRLSTVLLIVCLMSPLAKATSLLDQSTTDENSQSVYDVYSFSPIGQSFTPSDSTISFAQFMLVDLADPPGPEPVQVELLDKIGGSPIATSDTVTVAARVDPNIYTPSLYTFDFSIPVPLVKSQTYYLLLVAVDEDYVGVYTSGSSYSGGSIFDGSGTLTGDLYFSEGTSVPEPCSLTIFGLCVSFVVIRRPRRGAASASDLSRQAHPIS